MKENVGYTLVEVLVVLAIVSILATFAYRKYEAEKYKNNRVEAIASLTTAAHELERMHSDQGVYSPLNPIPPKSKYGHYNIAYSNQPCNNINNCYTVTATAQGEQANKDPKCVTFTLDNLGRKLSYKSTTLNAANLTTGCWSQ